MKVIKDNTIDINLDTGLDLTSYSVFKIGLMDPDKNKSTLDASIKGDAEDGILTASYKFEKEGNWIVWSIVDGSGGDATIITVYEVPEEEFQITTLGFVKEYLNIDSNEYDYRILNLIPVVERDYETIQNKPFILKRKSDEGFFYTKYYPPGSEATAAEMIAYKLFGRSPEEGYKDITSERIGSYSVTFSDSSTRGYPKSITSSIRKYTRFIS